MVLCVISLLTVYMAFLHLLDPWLTKRRQTAYKQHAEEEVSDLDFAHFSEKGLSLRAKLFHTTHLANGADVSQNLNGSYTSPPTESLLKITSTTKLQQI